MLDWPARMNTFIGFFSAQVEKASITPVKNRAVDLINVMVEVKAKHCFFLGK